MILLLQPKILLAQSEISPKFDIFIHAGDPVDFDCWAVPPDVYKQYREDHLTVPYLNQRLIDQANDSKQLHDDTGLIFGVALGLVGASLISIFTHK